MLYICTYVLLPLQWCVCATVGSTMRSSMSLTKPILLPTRPLSWWLFAADTVTFIPMLSYTWALTSLRLKDACYNAFSCVPLSIFVGWLEHWWHPDREVDGSRGQDWCIKTGMLPLLFFLLWGGYVILKKIKIKILVLKYMVPSLFNDTAQEYFYSD